MNIRVLNDPVSFRDAIVKSEVNYPNLKDWAFFRNRICKAIYVASRIRGVEGQNLPLLWIFYYGSVALRIWK